jgi:hypothetical protein
MRAKRDLFSDSFCDLFSSNSVAAVGALVGTRLPYGVHHLTSGGAVLVELLEAAHPAAVRLLGFDGRTAMWALDQAVDEGLDLSGDSVAGLQNIL